MIKTFLTQNMKTNHLDTFPHSPKSYAMFKTNKLSLKKAVAIYLYKTFIFICKYVPKTSSVGPALIHTVLY